MAFTLLETLAKSSEPIGTSELARRLGETKARVHRHLTTLRQLGFVEQDLDSTAYQLGWKAFGLSGSIAESFSLPKLARRHLLRLHRESGQTAALTISAGSQISVVDSIQSVGVAITIGTGSLIPAVSSALGRSILAFQSEDEIQAIFDESAKSSVRGAAFDMARLKSRLHEVRARWWEVAVNERLLGVAALAAPVFDDRSRVVASVGVIGSHLVVTDPPAQGLLRHVQDAAAAISADLRSSAWSSAEGGRARRQS